MTILSRFGFYSGIISVLCYCGLASIRADDQAVMVTVASNVDEWQRSSIVLAEDEQAIIAVPDIQRDGHQIEQRWRIIEPKNPKRGSAGYGGGDTFAGEKFALPNPNGATQETEVLEGALLVRSFDEASLPQWRRGQLPRIMVWALAEEIVRLDRQNVQAFGNKRRTLALNGPGEIQFIANDRFYCGAAGALSDCRQMYRLKGDGYSDNIGQMSVLVRITKKQ